MEVTGHSEIVEIDFASRVPCGQPKAQFLIQNSIFDDFGKFPAPRPPHVARAMVVLVFDFLAPPSHPPHVARVMVVFVFAFLLPAPHPPHVTRAMVVFVFAFLPPPSHPPQTLQRSRGEPYKQASKGGGVTFPRRRPRRRSSSAVF